MKRTGILAAFTLLVFSACQKGTDLTPGIADATKTAISTTERGGTVTTFTRYLIRKGNHYCDQNTVKSVSTSEMKFTAKFNSSAIYTTIDPVNQFDINKLWGFSEGLNHQYNSARIGWNYDNNVLRLHGYVYSKGVRYSQEITTIPLNTEILCSIKLVGSTYLITANGKSVTLPRGLSTTRASGYQLYPYFGGDETAPQDITIDLK